MRHCGDGPGTLDPRSFTGPGRTAQLLRRKVFRHGRCLTGGEGTVRATPAATTAVFAQGGHSLHGAPQVQGNRRGGGLTDGG